MSAQVIDLKQLRKEVAERPPEPPKEFKPRPTRKYIPKRFIPLQSQRADLKFGGVGGETASGLPLTEKQRRDFEIVTGFMPKAETVLPSSTDAAASQSEKKETTFVKKETAPSAVSVSEKSSSATAQIQETSVAKATEYQKIEIKEPGLKTDVFPVKKDNFLVSVAEKTMQEVIKEETKDALNTAKTPAILSWQAPEYVQADNSYERAILAGIVAVGFFIGSLVIGNYLLALIVLLAYVIIYLHAAKKPTMINFSVTNQGIRAGGSLYEYSDLKSFWVFYDPPYQKELSLEGKKVFMPYIKIPLDNVSPSELRKELVRFIPEKKHEEALTDIVARRVGF